MADPFAGLPGITKRKTSAGSGSTAAQFVPGGGFGVPTPKDWQLDNAIVNGYRASGWVYSCATILANHVASLPWKVWKPNSAGDMKVIPRHDLEFLIENPNAHHTRNFQMKLRTLHLCLGGNALDKVVTIGSKRKPTPAELWTLRPDSMRPVPDRRNWLSHWEARGRAGGSPDRLAPGVVCHSQFADPMDPYWGMAPLRAIGKPVDMDIAQVTWNRELVENDAAPSGVFVDPNIHGETERKLVKSVLKNHFSGPLHGREPLVLSGGAQWHQLGITPRELDWVQSRKFTVGEICTAFGLLTSRFLMDAQTYANLDAAIRYEWENGAIPIAMLIGDGLGLTLLTLEERRQGMRIRPDTSGVPVLRENVHKATESFEKLVRNTVPPQTAASVVDLPVGTLPFGDRSYRPATLEEITAEPEPTEEDL